MTEAALGLLISHCRAVDMLEPQLAIYDSILDQVLRDMLLKTTRTISAKEFDLDADIE